MTLRSIRAARNAQKRKRRWRRNIIWGGLGLAASAIIGILIWTAVRPAAGEAIPVISRDHIPENQPLPGIGSDPPTSGDHYASNLPAGFYSESDLARLPANPDGYLIHNLEHGYIIFWYNCELLDENGCNDLKGQIQSVMNDFQGVKLIAFPRNSLDVPLAMTSWGRLQKFDMFSPEEARDFISRNRNRAPEPDAP